MSEYATALITDAANPGLPPIAILPAMARVVQIGQRRLAAVELPAAPASGRKPRAGKPPPPYPNELRLLRKQKTNLSARAFALSIGMTPGYYAAFERGEKPLDMKWAPAMAGGLGVPVEALFATSTRHAVPIRFIVAAHESEGRPDQYELDAPYQYVEAPRRLAEPESCFVAEIADDSADLIYPPGTLLFVRNEVPDRLRPGTKVLVRFMAGPIGGDPDDDVPTLEILFGLVDRTLTRDLILLTRSRNRRVPAHMTIQAGSTRLHGLEERVLEMIPKEPVIEYDLRWDDNAYIMGIVEFSIRPE